MEDVYAKAFASVDLQKSGTRSMPDAVYQTVRAALLQGQLQSGDVLREVALASALGVSRTPVREALQRLIGEGLLQTARSRSVVVTTLDKQQVLEIYALREVLEGSAAAFAAARATEEDIAGLWALIAAERPVLDDPLALARLNKEFHLALNRAAHNRYLSAMVDNMNNTLALLRGTSLGAPGRAAVAHDEHRAIVSAIEERDAPRAEAVARSHIRAAKRVRMQMLYQHN